MTWQVCPGFAFLTAFRAGLQDTSCQVVNHIPTCPDSNTRPQTPHKTQLLVIMLLEDLKHQIRKMRGTEITHTDIQALLPSESQRKIPGTSINAYGACIEDVREDRDFCIFNSWIAPIASGQVKSGGAYGTIHGHVHASVRPLSSCGKYEILS
ncbi:uncharacterized protein EDB93DRAFT_1139153 [Suillus bovinus]|uniref:uncharacterized protein n=1 Tax=Suillus bovinus TaxID=48563 RepID=UPI001B8634C7|nr:uncharacterized protein EDB93DRAFT_1139153 [Suillus bovinus]KAG2151673.1 hypothetical protein EDB93DRAFT_1139153 [Suillus bovinus]